MAQLPPLPDNFTYSAEHEWINAGADAIVGNTVKIGITAVASDALGEVVYVDLPEVGDTVTAGETCGEVESTKSVSDLYSPVTGEITSTNEATSDNPGLLNSDPYGDGWLFEVKVTELGEVMDAAGYAEANSL
ncbi:MAG: glycine cleavage system protein GcvH [Brevibacterium sp.]|uniref:glycine cleavage system protein GcvH n=1 Tax=Brevibacterium sp. TaxID=1701 RepID=UPI002648F7AA|nr:glycine cleavage system protein GcvH [Brevibacterium sp.]MDN5910899.1 glycine cleavage system protein GcvH [Brevibacterium sp.]MDN6135242.1 glycine cleavage system protein GcvH [Brevibacterium sp.]MDN6159351.1 glycine cleavage system protein GcvH [Brevibacterium sp.]MDN6176878.1 glycine cleavage system protein GcvH [Brevibacterium sp.]MDN6529047.1 glycine cleavage system protein GcvH [Brevibacterium sp.]